MFVMTGQGLSAMDCLSVYLAGIQASFGKEQTVNILKVPRYPACFFLHTCARVAAVAVGCSTIAYMHMAYTKKS